MYRYSSLFVDFGDDQVDTATPGLLVLAGVSAVVTADQTVTATPGLLVLAGVAASSTGPKYPHAWTQYQPGSPADKTNTSLTPADADATNLAVTFVGPPSGLVVVVLNGLALGSASLSFGSWNIRDSVTGDIPGTLRRMISGNNRVRWEHRSLIEVTPGQSYTWTWGVAGDGTHAAGVQVGPNAHALMMVIDSAYDIQAKRLGYFERPVQDGGTGGGGSIDLAFSSTSTYQRALLEDGDYVDFPAFTIPASGIVEWGMWGTFTSATPATAEAHIAVWDRDTGTIVPNSGMVEASGFGSGRHHPHLRQILSGLTPGVANWSIAHRCDDNGGAASSNTQVFKFDQDAKEGPAVIPVYAVDA